MGTTYDAGLVGAGLVGAGLVGAGLVGAGSVGWSPFAQAGTLGVQVGRCASKVSMSATWRRVMPMSSRPSSRR
jgi:hypothetical protein